MRWSPLSPARPSGRPFAATRAQRVCNDEPYVVVGVIPDAIPLWMETPGSAIDVWTPLALDPGLWTDGSRGSRGATTLGRLKPNVSIEQAAADLGGIAAALAQRFPADRGVGVQIVPLIATRVGNLRGTLLLLMTAVGLLLTIACANVANRLLAHHASRQHEFAIRRALGASAGRLVRQHVTESAVLSLAGAIVGLMLASVAGGVLGRIRPSRLPQLAEFSVDRVALLFTAVVAFVVSVAVGAVPALVRSRANAGESLKEGGRAGSTEGKRRAGLTRVFIVAETSIALMLLIVALLLIESLARLQTQALGFRADHLLTEHLYLPATRYPDPSAITRFCDRFADRIRQLPGVVDASITAALPPRNRWRQTFTIVGRPPERVEASPILTFNVTDAATARPSRCRC